jgi:hypothetical protein
MWIPPLKRRRLVYRFTWSLNVAYNYVVVFGNATTTPAVVYPSYADIAYYYDGTTSNQLAPGPPCFVNALLYFPDTVSFGAALRPDENTDYGAVQPDVTSLSLQQPESGKVLHKDPSQGPTPATFGVERARRDAQAIFGDPRPYTPDTPDLPPVNQPPAPPLGPPPPPELPIVGRRK